MRYWRNFPPTYNGVTTIEDGYLLSNSEGKTGAGRDRTARRNTRSRNCCCQVRTSSAGVMR
jgi:hypothetical protein